MSLLVWYPLIKDMHNQGVANADLNIAASPTFTAGESPIGGSLSGGGTSTWTAAQTNKIFNNKELTISFWIYVNVASGTSSTANPQFFGNGSMGANNNRKFALFQYPTYNDLHFSWQNDAAESPFISAIMYGCLPSYKWTHVVLSYNNPILKIYINGSLVRTESGISSSSTFAYDTRVFWADTNRRLCDFRIYNHALSEKEAKELSKGLMLHFPLNGGGRSNENLMAGSHITLTQTANGSSSANYTIPDLSKLKTGTTITVSCDIELYGVESMSRIGVESSFANSSGTTFAYVGAWTTDITDRKEKLVRSYTMPQDATSVGQRGIYIQNVVFKSGGYIKVSNPKLEIGDKATPWMPNSADVEYTYMGYNSNVGTIIKDTSGYEHNMVINGSALTYDIDSPRYNISSYFSSRALLAQEYSNAFLPIYGLTANIWIKPTTWFNPFSCTESGGWNFEQNGNGYLQFPVYIAGIGYGVAVSTVTGASLQDGKWHMLTGTFDPNGGKVRFYIDGALKGSHDAGTTANIGYQTNKLVIGGEASGTGSSSNYYTSYVGNISDARVYATPLSEADIKELYQIGASIANNGILFGYEFMEG